MDYTWWTVNSSHQIHLVRHAEAAQRWTEASDPALSAAGAAQARGLAEAWCEVPPLAVRSSPLRRARETAAPLAEHWQRETSIDEDFREVPGPTDFALRPAWIEHLMVAHWRELDATVLAWRDRLWGALQALPAGTVVFTHFMVINAVVSLLEGRERLVVFKPDYCSATVLAPEAGALRLITLGESRATRVLV